jgi:universal stress protein E
MKRFKNILYVTEAIVDQASAVARAVSLAENNQANLTIIDVIPPVRNDLQAETMAKHMQALESLIEPYRQRLKIELDVLSGPVFLEVIRTVLRNAHDLVIKAAENPDFLQRLFGSDDMHLLRKCPCPLWIVNPPESSNYDCIMAAVDFDPLKPVAVEQPLNQEILELSSSLALSENASLHLVHAWEAFAEGALRARGGSTVNGIAAYAESERMRHQNWLYALGETLRDRIGTDAYNYLSPRYHLPKGPAQKVIAALATELRADLVVMGTVVRTGISGFIIGNTAEAILDQLTCSVLAIKPPGFTTPVKLDE